MAASVWMKCWNWPLRAGLDGAVLGGDDAGGDGLRKREGLPMASTQSPTCGVSELPSLTVGSGVLVSILMTARSVALSTPMTRAGRPRSWVSGSVESLT